MALVLDEITPKVKLVERESALKATISLDFGEFVVKGFRVQEGKYPNPKGDNLWLLPPSYQSHGKYHPIIFFPDKDLWEALSNKIWDAYYEATKSGGVKEDDGPNWV